MSLRVAFRVDASLHIGTGHVMRCLTLADAIVSNGGECLFICRPKEGDLRDAITARDHSVHALPASGNREYGPHPAPPPHANWLEESWQVDATSTKQAIDAFGADWLVVDHYALDTEWQKFAVPSGVKLAVIDDLADRPHMANLLLDQNYGRKSADYAKLVPVHCRVLVGPHYALLRPRFAELREEALQRRETSTTNHLLITLGGIDAQNATSAVLKTLAEANLPDDFEISVVMGASAPWLDEMKSVAADMPCLTSVLVNVEDMAGLMLTADFCIGAGGSTTWERCALGLPSALMVLADNQAKLIELLSDQGIVIGLDDPSSEGFSDQLIGVVATISDDSTRIELSDKCKELSDGNGCTRFLTFLEKGG